MIKRLFFLVVLLCGLGVAGYAGLRVLRQQAPMDKAVALLEQGNPLAAQVVLRNLVKAEPRNADAHMLLAKTQLMTSDWVGAEKELKIARALHYERSQVMPFLARSYVMQQRYDDVLAELPANAPTPDERMINLLFRAMAYTGLGDLGAAKDAVDAGLAINPNFSPLLLQSARIALRRKNIVAAERAVDQALSLNDRDVDALLVKADIQTQKWEKVAALATLDRAVALAPYSPMVRQARIPLLIDAGQDKAAQEDVDKVFEAGPQDLTARYYNAVLMYRAKKYADASIEFDKLGFATDMFPKAYYYRGLTDMAMNQPESALGNLMKFVRLQPADPEGVRLAAELQFKMERPEKAAEVLNRAVASGLKDASIYDMLGRANFMMGKLPEAVDAYRNAVRIAPDNREYATHLAAAQTRFGDVPAAKSGAPTARD